MIKNIIHPANIICDCDEILCNIAPLWVKRMIDNKEKFNHYFDLDILEGLSEDELYNNIMERPNFYINLWLKRKDVQITEDELNTLMEEYINLYDTDDFYSNLEPTDLAINLTKICYTTMVKKVYVVTRCTEKNLRIKKEFIESIIPKSKLEILVVPSDAKKSDYVNGIDMTKGIIFEDELKNINDYLDNCQGLNEVNIYVPLLGYNQPTQDLYDKCKEKNVEIIYYPTMRKGDVLEDDQDNQQPSV